MSEYAAELSPVFDPRPRAWQIALLALIVIVASGVRFALIGAPVYELDEYWHAELSTGRGSAQNHQPKNVLFDPGPRVTSLNDAPPFYRVWSHMDDTVHPPLYPLLLRIWRATIGEGPGPSRSLGALLSVLSIIVLFDVARRLHGTTIALFAAAIFAVASPQISMARTLRGYTTGLFFLLCLADVVVSLEKKPAKATWRLILIGLFTLLSALTFYFTVFVLSAIGVYILFALRGRARWGAIVAMIVAGFVFIAIWGPWLIDQRATLPARTDDWIFDGWAGHKKRVFTWATSLPLRMLFEPRRSATIAATMGATLFIVPIFFLHRRRDLLLWVLWLWLSMLPLLTADLIRDTKHLYHIRYSLAAGPAVFALLAALLRHMQQVSLRYALPTVTILACTVSIASAYEEPRLEYDGLATFIDQRIQPGEAIVIYDSPNRWVGNALFLTLTGESKTYPWPMVMLDQMPAPADVQAQLRAKPGVWLITESQQPTTDELIPGGKLVDWIYIPHVALVRHVVFGK